MTPDNPLATEAPPTEFYVLKHGEMFGPFSDEQLREGLKEGHFAPEDFVQTEGQSEWLPLGNVLGNGAEAETPRGAMAPDWKCILRWAWFRMRYNLDAQSFPAGLACLGVGVISLVLSRWPFVFWLPWFAAAGIASVALLKRKQERHGAALLIGAVCIPLLFIVLESLTSSHGTAPSSGINSTALPAPAVAVKQARTPAAESTEKSATITAPSQATPPPPIPDANAVIPEPVTPHYAIVPPESTPVPVLEPVKPAPAPKATSAPAPGIPGIPDAAAAPEEEDFVHSHGNSLVVVKGSEGSGSGFVCNNGKGTLLYTNIHVIADILQPVMTGMEGELISPGSADAAAGRDIARFELAKPAADAFESIIDFEQNVRIDDAVVVLGNSGGGGVVTKIKGKIVGIGPDRIEVSAEFIPGNSGSPIIHVKTGKVVGIATYITRRYDEFAKAQGEPVTRRFGYRIDNVPTWETLRWPDFRQDAETMRHITALTEDIFNFFGTIKTGGSPNFATDSLRHATSDWMSSLRKTHVSEADRRNATRGFLNSLRFLVRNDVTAAEPRLRYTYFREELRHQREIRDRLYKAFDEQSAKLSSSPL